VNGRIGVIGTESTINGRSYEHEILRIRPEVQVFGTPCPLFVSLAEEGWCDGPIAELTARRYLEGMIRDTDMDTLVLGCTHFPALSATIAQVVGPNIRLVDSARTTARFVRDVLARLNLQAASAKGALTFLATDGAERFARVGGVFLHAPLSPADVEIVDL
jgi:glutamate racemase